MRYDSTKSYYESQAAKYAEETLSFRLDSLWDTFSSMLSPNAYILDLGCGSGRDLKELALRGFRVMGLEYSEPLAQLAREYSGQKVCIGDMRTFDLGVNQFDGIWAVASLLHVPRKHVLGVLEKLRDSLRSGGLLLTSMKRGVGHDTAPDGRTFELYQPEEWNRLLEAAAFEIEGLQESAEKRQTASGNARQIEWFVTIARKR